jgi:hypothetical protein
LTDQRSEEVEKPGWTPPIAPRSDDQTAREPLDRIVLDSAKRSKTRIDPQGRLVLSVIPRPLSQPEVKGCPNLRY